MDDLSVFNPLKLLISSLVVLSFFPFYLSFFCSMLSLSFSLPWIWLYERLQLLHPPIVSPNQYLPMHYCDHKLKNGEMDPVEFTEFLKCLSPLGVQ